MGPLSSDLNGVVWGESAGVSPSVLLHLHLPRCTPLHPHLVTCPHGAKPCPPCPPLQGPLSLTALGHLSRLLCKKHLLTPQVLSCTGCSGALLSSRHHYSAPWQIEAWRTPVWGVQAIPTLKFLKSGSTNTPTPPGCSLLKAGFLGTHQTLYPSDSPLLSSSPSPEIFYLFLALQPTIYHAVVSISFFFPSTGFWNKFQVVASAIWWRERTKGLTAITGGRGMRVE